MYDLFFLPLKRAHTSVLLLKVPVLDLTMKQGALKM